LREFRVDSTAEVKVGDKIDVNQFKSGVSLMLLYLKGKGFAGVVKRHGFAGGPKHMDKQTGTRSGSYRATTSPGRVSKVCAWPAIWARADYPERFENL